MSHVSYLASPSATRAVLERHGLATKKALGQNFLVNNSVIARICELSEVCADDAVLEVSPGIGTLTVALLARAGRVLSVERDTDLPAVLAETCADFDNFTLLSKDALTLSQADLDEAFGEAAAQGEAPNKFVANLPYAVAATLVLDFFQRFSSLQCATVMVQSEVADRMMAKMGAKNYGAYTVKLNLIAKPTGSFPGGPRQFLPAASRHVGRDKARPPRRFGHHGRRGRRGIAYGRCRLRYEAQDDRQLHEDVLLGPQGLRRGGRGTSRHSGGCRYRCAPPR